MPLPGIVPKTQADLVPEEKQLFTDIVKLPGIELLHTKSADEIGAVLANFIKSRPSMTSMTFVIGKHIEVVSQR